MNWVERQLGGITIAIGLTHLTLGIVGSGRIWADMWDDGLFNTISTDERGELLCFCVTGLLLICTGLLMRAHIRVTGALPLSFGIVVLVTCVAVAVLAPVSGIWAVLAVALIAIRMAVRNRAVSHALRPANTAHGAGRAYAAVDSVPARSLTPSTSEKGRVG